MARRSDEALAGLLGLGSQSARKSHYPELLARLEEGGSFSDGEATGNGTEPHHTGLFDKIKDFLGGG